MELQNKVLLLHILYKYLLSVTGYSGRMITNVVSLFTLYPNNVREMYLCKCTKVALVDLYSIQTIVNTPNSSNLPIMAFDGDKHVDSSEFNRNVLVHIQHVIIKLKQVSE